VVGPSPARCGLRGPLDGSRGRLQPELDPGEFRCVDARMDLGYLAEVDAVPRPLDEFQRLVARARALV